MKAKNPLDPFLTTGFNKKVLLLNNDTRHAIDFTIKVNILDNNTWTIYKTTAVGAKGYNHHELFDRFLALWVRVSSNKPARKV